MIRKSALYATPRKITKLGDCLFYHTVDLPGHGVIAGQWDLRKGAEKFLGGVSVAGKRVLEIGTADGFLAFDMEKRGAQVVGHDLSPEDAWDIVPFGGSPSAENRAATRDWTVKLNNAWWFLHRLERSKAKVAYGSVYQLPAELGPFHISTISCVLLHLRDPFLAMQRVAAVTTEALIVTDMVPGFRQVPHPGSRRRNSAPIVLSRKIARRFRLFLTGSPDPIGQGSPFTFLPDDKAPAQWTTWWHLLPLVIQRYMAILGFPETTITYHDQYYEVTHQWKTMYTVVGRRAPHAQ